jgi:3-dehydroquinate synthetase
VVERLWNELEIGRDGWIVGFGGGSTTDVAGSRGDAISAASSGSRCRRRSSAWSMPRSAARPAINTDEGRTSLARSTSVGGPIDPRFLATLAAEERRAGMAEVVKTGFSRRGALGAADEEMIRACAAFKAAVVLSDPYEREGARAILNLGHTFRARARGGSGYELRHGDAGRARAARGARLSGTSDDVVEEVLAPEPVRVDRDRAWDALLRDKKGRLRLVLLGDDGGYVTRGPGSDVTRALDELIAD